MNKRLTAILMAMLTVLLAGCGTTAEQSGSSGTTPPSESTQTPETSTASDTEESTPSKSSGSDGTLTTNGGTEIAIFALAHQTEGASAPAAYFISDITPEAMVEIYNALEWSPTGNMAVKLSTGEPPASNYLRPELIQDLVQLVDGIQWGNKKYMNMKHLEAICEDASAAI